MDRRPLIGGIAAILLTAGAIAFFCPQLIGNSAEAVAASCIRVGSVMLALWLAIPDLHRIPSWMWGGLVVVLVVIALRPRAALFILPVLAGIWMIMPKHRRSSS